MTDSSAHAYAAGLVQSGTPIPHAARMSGLSTADIGYLKFRPRAEYVRPKPHPAPPEPIQPVAFKSIPKPVGIQAFEQSCANNGITVEEAKSQDRRRALAWPRQAVMFDLFTKCPHLSLPAIGRMIGGRHHTTIIHGVEKHCARIDLRYEDAVTMRTANG